MKKYFIHYYKDFGNTYTLYWTDGEAMEKALPEKAQRITRRQALERCREESAARRNDPSFAGYASASIYPAGYEGDIANDRRYELRGRIWERK